MRRTWWLAVTLLVGACGPRGDAPLADEWGGPEALSFPGAHLLLVSVDTLRADRLGCYGYERPTTPRLDALARESVRFADMYSNSCKTASSHMSLFTSLLPTVHNVRNWSARLGLERTSLGANRITLPQVLNQSGYTNAAVTCAGNIRPEMGFARGFRLRFDSRMDDVSWHVGRTLKRFDEILAAGTPGFVFMHTYQVHGPYLPPPAQMKQFAPHPSGEIAERVAVYAKMPFLKQWSAMNHGVNGQPPFWEGHEHWGADEAAYLSDLYDGEVAYTDEQLGVLLDGLAERGLLERMIVVVLADHGEEFFEHGSFEHDQLFHEQLHVPLIMHLPGGRRGGTVVKGMASLIDVMPTLLELLDLQGPATMTGVSLVPAIVAGRTQDRPVLSERVMFLPNEFSASLRTPRHAVSFLTDLRDKGPGKITAYDLVSDPDELDDVYPEAAFAQPAAKALHAELVSAFRAQAALDAVDSGKLIRLTDEDTVSQLAALGYVGSEEPADSPPVEGTPLDRWPDEH